MSPVKDFDASTMQTASLVQPREITEAKSPVSGSGTNSTHTANHTHNTHNTQPPTSLAQPRENTEAKNPVSGLCSGRRYSRRSRNQIHCRGRGCVQLCDGCACESV